MTMTSDKLRALADALDEAMFKLLTYKHTDEAANTCQRAADYLRAQADAKPFAWMSAESAGRLLGGGNGSRGTVPVHCNQSHVSTIPLYTHPAPAAPQAMEDANVWKQIVPDDEPQAEPKREPLTDERITKGEYVFATKWDDGDPGDHWGVGFYDRFANGRHYVVDSAGKQIRGNGFRRVGRITVEVGRWLLSAAKSLEASPPGTVNLWTMLTERARRIGGNDGN